MSENKKDVVFYYLDTLIDSSNVEIKRNDEGGIISIGVKLLFYISVKNSLLSLKGSDIWFNRKEALMICKMFDINFSFLDSYLNEYFSMRFDLDINDEHIEYFNTKHFF